MIHITSGQDGFFATTSLRNSLPPLTIQINRWNFSSMTCNVNAVFFTRSSPLA
ncbi:hypothetical protein HMPREF1861_02248 [Corynebacterium kroppenstedtii]|nr:hypothetical protein HMPREF1861_02248 [Corynebacterium kroppenstedtii]